MKTTKAISTISFNSKQYLTGTLERLTKKHIITFWAYIQHFGEDDDGGKKDHFHVYIEPASSIQTEGLRTEFVEPVPNDKPLSCLPFRPTSDFGEWYKYSMHDKAYLVTKMLEKKYHYSPSDFVVSDDDYFVYLVKNVQFNEQSVYQKMLWFQRNGFNFGQFIQQVNAPINQVRNLERAWTNITAAIETVYYIDDNTGEICFKKAFLEKPFTKQEKEYQKQLGEMYHRQQRMREIEDNTGIAKTKLQYSVPATAEGSGTVLTLSDDEELPF